MYVRKGVNYGEVVRMLQHESGTIKYISKEFMMDGIMLTANSLQRWMIYLDIDNEYLTVQNLIALIKTVTKKSSL